MKVLNQATVQAPNGVITAKKDKPIDVPGRGLVKVLSVVEEDGAIVVQAEGVKVVFRNVPCTLIYAEEKKDGNNKKDRKKGRS